MNILYVVPYYAPAWGYGGPPKVVHDVATGLAARGHSVTVYTTDVFDSTKRLNVTEMPTIVDGCQVYYFRNLSNSLAWNQNLYLPLNLVSVTPSDIAKFDIVHLHDYRTFANAVIHGRIKKANVPYVLSAHGSILRIISKRAVKRAFDMIWGYQILRDADLLIALAEGEAAEYRQMCHEAGVAEPARKIKVIPNGLDLKELEDLPEKGTFRKSFGIKDDEQLVLFLGRLHVKKGLDVLISAFSKLDSGNVRLAIVGPDEGYLSKAKELLASHGLSDKAIFTGSLTGADKLGAYLDADLFVLPSRSEGLPTTVLEACALGVPVVITNASNVPEVADYEAGRIIDLSVDELAQALKELLSDSDLRKRMGANGKRMVEEKFRLGVVLEAVEKTYETVIQQNQRSRAI